MSKYIFFLGYNPTLSALELITILKRQGYVPRIEIACAEYMLLELDKDLPGDFLKSLGGIDRIAMLVASQSSLWEAREVVSVLSPTMGQAALTGKKFSLGISTLNIDSGYAKKVGFEIKKLFKEGGVKIKFILPQGKVKRLNAAQVIFNKLTSPPNKELTIIEYESEYLLTETKQIQDILFYERRDIGRPARDARVGMLPPKLAQIMLNLVPKFTGQPPVILDPFCGLGTILQEGLLMGYDMIGSDMSERMVEASRKNLDALDASGMEFSRCLSPARFRHLFRHDVVEQFPEELAGKIDAVVTEPDLGKPISTPLPWRELKERIRKSKRLYLSFFANVRPTLKDDAWIIFALPAFRQRSAGKEQFTLFPADFLDEVRKLGYRFSQLLPQELKHYYEASKRGTVIYARPDALVGRELTLWHTRKREDQHN